VHSACGRGIAAGNNPERRELLKKRSEGFLQFEDLFPDLFHGLFLKGFLPLFGRGAAPGIKTPDEPDSILRSKGIDQASYPTLLDLGNCLIFHDSSASPSRKLFRIRRDDPLPFHAIKMCIETDECQIKFFSSSILVRVIKIEPGRFRDLLCPVHVFRHQSDDPDTSFTEEVPGQNR
jgi:hypothetical protein